MFLESRCSHDNCCCAVNRVVSSKKDIVKSGTLEQKLELAIAPDTKAMYAATCAEICEESARKTKTKKKKKKKKERTKGRADL